MGIGLFPGDGVSPERWLFSEFGLSLAAGSAQVPGPRVRAVFPRARERTAAGAYTRRTMGVNQDTKRTPMFGCWSHLSSPSVITTGAAPKLCASMLTKPVPAPSSNTALPVRSSFSAPGLAQASTK